VGLVALSIMSYNVRAVGPTYGYHISTSDKQVTPNSNFLNLWKEPQLKEVQVFNGIRRQSCECQLKLLMTFDAA